MFMCKERHKLHRILQMQETLWQFCLEVLELLTSHMLLYLFKMFNQVSEIELFYVLVNWFLFGCDEVTLS